MKIQNGPADRARAQRAADLRARGKGYSKGAESSPATSASGDKVVLSVDALVKKSKLVLHTKEESHPIN